MGHVSPVYLSHLVNELRRNEAARGLDKILEITRKVKISRGLVHRIPLKPKPGLGGPPAHVPASSLAITAETSSRA
jgi:hypothetical protein